MADGHATSRTALCAGVVILAAGLSAGVHVQLRPRNTFTLSDSTIESLISRGDYRDAERAAREQISSLEQDQSSGAKDLTAIRDLLVEALIGGGKAGDPFTLQLAQANVEAKRRAEPSNRASVAISLHNLGDVHFQRGEYSEALAVHQAGLDLRNGLALPHERDIADSLERLAATQMRIERYDEAEANLTKAREFRIVWAAEEPLKLATTLELLAWLYRYKGDYQQAEELARQVLATRRRLAPDHPALITAIEVQGDLSMLRGDIATAAKTWQEALALAERTIGDEHPLISSLERRLAYSADAFGNRTESRQRLERALRVAERTRAECDPELIATFDYLAGSLMFDGEYVEARKRSLRNVELSQRCLGSENSNTATAVFNLAALATQMGDFLEAERLYERAIQAWSARGPADSYVAKGLDALAEVYEISGDAQRARGLYERALMIRRQIRADHPDVAWTLTNLARVIAASGDISLALRDLREATEIYRKNGTSIEPDHLARTMNQRGDIHARRGDYLMARSDFREALALRQRIFGPQHPLTAESLLKVATVDFALGRYNDALLAARQAREKGLDHVKFTVRYLPERRALAYAARTTRGIGLELSLATLAPVARPSQFLDAVIRSRSIVLDELGARAHVLADPSPQAAAIQRRLNTARQRYANLMLRSMGAEGSSVDAAEMLNVARREREEAEQALAEQSATFRSQLARGEIGYEEVRRSLPRGSALVSFVRYERTSASDDAGSPLGRQHSRRGTRVEQAYVAFVLRSIDAEPAIVQLTEAATIDALVTNWRRRMLEEIGSGSEHAEGQSLRVLGERIRQQIWDPLVTHLNGVNQVLVVPDGAINLLPIAALPTEGGGYLLEQRAVIHYLSAERDVVRTDEPPRASSGLLALGGPAFSDTSSFAALSSSKPEQRVTSSSASNAVIVESQESVRRSATTCVSFGSIGFDALPGARVEAEVIGKLWDQFELGKPPQDHARVLTGPFATERAFKEFGPKRRILHLATHGFFLGDECNPVVQNTRAVGGLTSANSAGVQLVPEPLAAAAENPLLLSGLALAGANRRSAAALDEEDGILTAEEVAAMNLEGVEWAVLSACDTGLGTVSAGEGIFGLRRAFQVAGVRTVVMSLWSVEDVAARQWMEALYRARLVDGRNTADSIRQASLRVIQERRAKGLSTHPFYWASFVAAGDWR